MEKHTSLNEEEKILNKCPLCGNTLEYFELMQYSDVYKILKNGKLSAKRIRKSCDGPMNCGFITCATKECKFHTNCDLEAEDNNEVRVFKEGDVFKYTVDEQMM